MPHARVLKAYKVKATYLSEMEAGMFSSTHLRSSSCNTTNMVSVADTTISMRVSVMDTTALLHSMHGVSNGHNNTVTQHAWCQ